MTKSTTRIKADLQTFTQAEITAKDVVAKAGRKNLIINGGFDVWQRGTTGSVVGGPSYASADRWKLYVNASSTMTLSRQTFSPGQTEVPGNPKYYAKFDWLGTSSSQFFGFEQMIEGCHHAAGGYLTVSFYARTEQADDITLGVNQVFGSGGSASVTVGNFPVDTETTWKKFVVTMPVPSIAGKTVGADDTLAFTFYRSGTLNSYLEVANVQVELGSVATDFEHRSYGEELALCQRYYYKQIAGSGNSSEYSPFGLASAYATNAAWLPYKYPVEMRAVPSFDYSGAFQVYQGPSADTLSSMFFGQATNQAGRVDVRTASSWSSGSVVYVRAYNDASAYMAFDAEL